MVQFSPQQSPLYITPEERALLDTLHLSESAYTSDPYAVLFGGDSFTDLGYDFSRHPGIHRPYGNTTSTAAGRYQFLEGTWNDISTRYGLRDFSPRAQDMGAVLLAREAFGANDPLALSKALASGDPERIAQVAARLRGTWPSITGGSQQNSAGANFVSNYQNARSTISAPAQPAGPVQPGQPGFFRAGASMTDSLPPPQQQPMAPIQWNNVDEDYYPQPELWQATAAGLYAALGPDWTITVNNAYRPQSTRGYHPHKKAWDFGVVNTTTGERLTWDDPRTRAFALESAARGVKGFGAGPNYMGGNTFHFDLGGSGVRTWSDDDGTTSSGGPGAAMWLEDLRAARASGSTRGLFFEGQQQNGAISQAMMSGTAYPTSPAGAGGPTSSSQPLTPSQQAEQAQAALNKKDPPNPFTALAKNRPTAQAQMSPLQSAQSLTPLSPEGGLRPTRRAGT